MSLFTSWNPAILRSYPSSSARIAGLALRTLIEYILSFGDDFLCPIAIFAGAACPAWDFSGDDLSPAELDKDLEEDVLCIAVLMEAEIVEPLSPPQAWRNCLHLVPAEQMRLITLFQWLLE